MHLLKNIFKLLLKTNFIPKIIAYTLLLLAFWLFSSLMLIFFLTFIFAYLFLSFAKFLKWHIDYFGDKIFYYKNINIHLKKFLSINMIVTFLYLWFLSFFFYTIVDLPVKLNQELSEIMRQVPLLSEPISQINSKLLEIRNIGTELWKNINEIITKQDIELLGQAFQTVKNFWIIFLKVMLALVLSFVFIIDRERLKIYLKTIETSHFGFLYTEYKTILDKIVKSFWAAFKAQSFIAGTNAILTTIWLMIIWFFNIWAPFPFIYTLALIVFICWFIPFIGLYISSIPILLIAFSMDGGWFGIIFQIIGLLVIINIIEAVYLNPKIVSSLIHMPISLTFVILIISEHFLWFAGLIIGIWVFYFMVDLLKDFNRVIDVSKKILSQKDQLEQETKDQIKKSVRVSRKI